MTVRAKTDLHRALRQPGVTAVWVRSNTTGELQVQALNYEGKMTCVFIPSSAGLASPRLVNLLAFGPVTAWQTSRSLMAAVRAGQVSVTLASGTSTPKAQDK